MLPIKTILHPTDFSDHSEEAFVLACALARDYGAHLVVLHVVAVPLAFFPEVPLSPHSQEKHQEVLKAKLQQMKPDDANIRLSHRLEIGNPAEEILRVARIIHADLIVLGTHGRRGLKRFLMGSVADQVARQAPCPVLTVKTPFPASVPAPEMELPILV